MKKDSMMVLLDMLTGYMPVYDAVITKDGLASEIVETKDAFYWRFELPGFDASQVEVSVLETEQLLKVKAVKQASCAQPVKLDSDFKSELKLVQESIGLSYLVDTLKITSEMKNGVLTVTLPKLQSAKELPRKVEVKS